MTDLSDAASDKLQAALNYEYDDPDDDPGAAYREACREWFGKLSERALAACDGPPRT